MVIARPGWHLPQTGPVAEWLTVHALQRPVQLRQQPAGGVLVQELRPLDISSTEIRAMLAAGAPHVTCCRSRCWSTSRRTGSIDNEVLHYAGDIRLMEAESLKTW